MPSTTSISPADIDPSTHVYATLVITDDYTPGALVLAHALRGTSSHALVCLVTSSVSSSCRTRLEEAFDTVHLVPELDSHDRVRLALLGRPELGGTLTKIHLWRLVEYRRVVYLDADTLPIQNIDELFRLECGDATVWAAPDCGWPDCFNSGVMVLTPSTSTYNDLLQLWRSFGTFDGGDQGLLNDFFASESSVLAMSNSNLGRRGTWKPLPFVYNVTPTAFYSYLPAMEARRSQIRVIHFIGANGKPWRWPRDALGRVLERPEFPGGKDLVSLVAKWWAIHDEYVYRWVVLAYAGIKSWKPFSALSEIHEYRVGWDHHQIGQVEPIEPLRHEEVRDIPPEVPMPTEPMPTASSVEWHPSTPAIKYVPPAWVIPVPPPPVEAVLLEEFAISRSVTPTVVTQPQLHPVIPRGRSPYYTVDDRWGNEGSSANDGDTLDADSRYDFATSEKYLYKPPTDPFRPEPASSRLYVTKAPIRKEKIKVVDEVDDDVGTEMFAGRYNFEDADTSRYVAPADPFRPPKTTRSRESSISSTSRQRNLVEDHDDKFESEAILRAYPIPESWVTWSKQLVDDLGHTLKDQESRRRLELWSNELSVIEQVGTVTKGAELFRGTSPPNARRRRSSVHSDIMEDFSMSGSVKSTFTEAAEMTKVIAMSTQTSLSPSPELRDAETQTHLDEVASQKEKSYTSSPDTEMVTMQQDDATLDEGKSAQVAFEETISTSSKSVHESSASVTKDLHMQKRALQLGETATVMTSLQLVNTSNEEIARAENNTCSTLTFAKSGETEDYDEVVEVFEVVEEVDESGHIISSTSQRVDHRVEHHHGAEVTIIASSNDATSTLNAERQQKEQLHPVAMAATAEEQSEEYDELIEEIEVVEHIDQFGNVVSSESRSLGTHVEHHHGSAFHASRSRETSEQQTIIDRPSEQTVVVTHQTPAEGAAQIDEDEYDEIIEEIEVIEELDEHGNVISSSSRSLGSHVEHHHGKLPEGQDTSHDYEEVIEEYEEEVVTDAKGNVVSRHQLSKEKK